MMELVIGINRYFRRGGCGSCPGSDRADSLYVRGKRDYLNGLSKCCLGGYERLATLILAPKGAMVTRFPEAKTVVGHLDLYYK